MIMRKLHILLLLLMISGCSCLFAQSIQLLTKDDKTSLRGLSVVNDKVIWVSGNKGTVGKSTDGGNTWKWLTVHGFENRDFRDIEAFDAATAIIMAIDAPAYILKTTNGGDTWKVVYQNNTPGMFLDAMEFWNEQSGIVIGDPINGKFFIARTFDEGKTWKPISADKLPLADPGEACFASSGTNIRRLDRDEACFITGGKKSRLFWKGEPIDLPIIQGKETTGANSIAVRDDKKLKGSKYFVVVGGDFSQPADATNNCFITKDAGKTWTAPAVGPHGYRSCIEFIDKKKMVTCGTSGVDFSEDGGITWKLISNESFHVCRKAKDGKAVFLAGTNGKIAKLVW
jgi:photosystem II stability/assembly factor-like uncharacterized protein